MEEAPSHDSSVGVVVHTLLGEERRAWGGHAGNRDPLGKILLDIAGKQLDAHAFVDKLVQVCRSLFCSLGIRHVVLWDEHTDIHLQRNNTRILHTTNIRACVSGYIHGETRKHLPFYTSHAANVCRQLPSVHDHADGLTGSLGVESSEVRGWYA